MKLYVLVIVCVCHVIGGMDLYCTGGWGKTRYYLYIILLEERTYIARADEERRGIIYILYYWRKGPAIEPVKWEDGTMIYVN